MSYMPAATRLTAYQLPVSLLGGAAVLSHNTTGKGLPVTRTERNNFKVSGTSVPTKVHGVVHRIGIMARCKPGEWVKCQAADLFWASVLMLCGRVLYLWACKHSERCFLVIVLCAMEMNFKI